MKNGADRAPFFMVKRLACHYGYAIIRTILI
jgi:hypothetical protein